MQLAGEVPSFAQFKASYHHRRNFHKLRQHQCPASPPQISTTATITNMIRNREHHQRDHQAQPHVNIVQSSNDDVPSEITIFPEDTQYCPSPIPSPPQRPYRAPLRFLPTPPLCPSMPIPSTHTSSAVRRIRPLRQRGRLSTTAIDYQFHPHPYLSRSHSFSASITHHSSRKTASWEIYRLFVLCVVLCGGLLLSLYRIGITSDSA